MFLLAAWVSLVTGAVLSVALLRRDETEAGIAAFYGAATIGFAFIVQGYQIAAQRLADAQMERADNRAQILDARLELLGEAAKEQIRLLSVIAAEEATPSSEAKGPTTPS
jgi:hypothetical protein